MFRKSQILAAALLAGTSLGAMAGTVTPVTNVPADGVIYGFQLTDGSLLFQGGLLQDFYRFKPDSKGSYVKRHPLSRRSPAAELHSLRHLRRRPARRTRAFDWRGVFAAVK